MNRSISEVQFSPLADLQSSFDLVDQGRILLVDKKLAVFFTPTEARIITLLLSRSGEVVRDQHLRENIKETTSIITSVSPANLLERHMRAIRQKLIQTGVRANVYRVRNRGYVFLPEDGSAEDLDIGA